MSDPILLVHSKPLLLQGQVWALAAAVVLFLLFQYLNKQEVPHIKGLPEAPGVPIFGSLIAMGDCHARKARQWVSTLGPVFQVRLGNRRLIYANTFDSVKDLWIGEQAALISRPLTYTFHQIVSTTQGFTLGTSPWNDGVKRARKAAATALNRIATQSYLPIIDLESTNSINEMLTNCVNPETQKTDLDPNGYFQRFSLNISLTLNYGIRIDGNIHNKILNEAVHCERELGNLRSVSHNWQDYIPLLRLLPQHTAKEYRGRRDAYINHFLSQLKERMANGTDIPCIAGNIIKDPEAKMTDKEIKTICITMVAAGLDTLPGNINMTTAFLGSAEGRRVQQKAYSEIMATYPDGDAWDKVLQEEAVPYMSALVKESLRYWSNVPLSFPRESVKDIVYNGATIPKGTTFILNTYAANHDEAHFTDPDSFVPERFLDVDEKGLGTLHYGYGAGSRMCAGYHLANRELYTIFARLILAFEVSECRDERSRPILDPLECNEEMTSLNTQPKPFKVALKPRDVQKLRVDVARSLERTASI